MFLFFAATVSAQVTSDTLQQNEQINQQIENISESTGTENPDLTPLVESLHYYAKHPLNLNTATREQLEDLGLLNDIQVTNLLEHRDRFGPLINLYELQTIDGFDLASINTILPYVRVSDVTNAGHFSFHQMLKDGSSTLVFRDQRVLEQQKGFSPIDSASLAKSPNSRYLGSPDHLYARYRFSYGTFVSAGITADKDPGEQFGKGAQKYGFDFYSGHVAIRNVGIVKAAVLGDYQLSFGQGLTAWTGYAFGKTSLTLNTRRSAAGVRPYSSVDENKFLRGAATTLRFGKIEATGFVSYKKRDANVVSADTLGAKNIEVNEFSSLQTTGLHTTPAEIADKGAIHEKIYGGNLTYRGKRFEAGVTGMHSEYNANFVRNLSLYSQFQFSSRSNDVVGANYDWLLRNFHFFGEGSRSANGGYAFVNGVLISLDPRLAITVHQRYLGRDFQNLYANTFSENTTPANERGLYFGVQAIATTKLTINAYFDHYVFPWLQYQVDAPSSGSDFLVQANYTYNKKTQLYFRYRHHERYTNAGDAAAPLDYIVPLTHDNYRFNISYPAGPTLQLGNRIEYTKYHQSNANAENGFVIWQEARFHKPGTRLTLTARYALFQTDSYNSAIYAYENEVPYYFTIPAYYYHGSRVYLVGSWSVTRKLDVYFRIAQTYYSNQNVISAGSLNEIDGNTKTQGEVEVKFSW